MVSYLVKNEEFWNWEEKVFYELWKVSSEEEKEVFFYFILKLVV